jgi:hypothetical protein
MEKEFRNKIELLEALNDSVKLICNISEGKYNYLFNSIDYDNLEWRKLFILRDFITHRIKDKTPNSVKQLTEELEIDLELIESFSKHLSNSYSRVQNDKKYFEQRLEDANLKGMTEASYTRNEVMKMFGVKGTAITNWKNGNHCNGKLKAITGEVRQTAVTFMREDIVKFLEANSKFNGSFKPHLWNVDEDDIPKFRKP